MLYGTPFVYTHYNALITPWCNPFKSFMSQVSLAEGLLGGCPACYSNFLNLWCTISCSPNQSTFMNVTKVTDMGGVLEVRHGQSTLHCLLRNIHLSCFQSWRLSIELGQVCQSYHWAMFFCQFSLSGWLLLYRGIQEGSFQFLQGMHKVQATVSSYWLLCLLMTIYLHEQDVKYGVLNLKAMDLFEGPKSGDEWLKYLGSKDKHSPYQINFVDSIPDEITPLNSSIPGCGSPGFECSCADCASAPYCQQVILGQRHGLTRWFEGIPK